MIWNVFFVFLNDNPDLKWNAYFTVFFVSEKLLNIPKDIRSGLNWKDQDAYKEISFIHPDLVHQKCRKKSIQKLFYGNVH